jgi:hypothetical protein
LPFNGDPRAQYGVFTWQSTVARRLRAVEYDRAQTYQAFETAIFCEMAGRWRASLCTK